MEGLNPSKKLRRGPASCQSLKTGAEGSVAQLEGLSFACLLLPASVPDVTCLPPRAAVSCQGQPCLRAHNLLHGDIVVGLLQEMLPHRHCLVCEPCWII